MANSRHQITRFRLLVMKSEKLPLVAIVYTGSWNCNRQGSCLARSINNQQCYLIFFVDKTGSWLMLVKNQLLWTSCWAQQTPDWTSCTLLWKDQLTGLITGVCGIKFWYLANFNVANWPNREIEVLKRKIDFMVYSWML